MIDAEFDDNGICYGLLYKPRPELHWIASFYRTEKGRNQAVRNNRRHRLLVQRKFQLNVGDILKVSEPAVCEPLADSIQRCPYCKGVGRVTMNGEIVGCGHCNGTGINIDFQPPLKRKKEIGNYE